MAPDWAGLCSQVKGAKLQADESSLLSPDWNLGRVSLLSSGSHWHEGPRCCCVALYLQDSALLRERKAKETRALAKIWACGSGHDTLCTSYGCNWIKFSRSGCRNTGDLQVPVPEAKHQPNDNHKPWVRNRLLSIPSRPWERALLPFINDFLPPPSFESTEGETCHTSPTASRSSNSVSEVFILSFQEAINLKV